MSCIRTLNLVFQRTAHLAGGAVKCLYVPNHTRACFILLAVANWRSAGERSTLERDLRCLPEGWMYSTRRHTWLVDRSASTARQLDRGGAEGPLSLQSPTDMQCRCGPDRLLFSPFVSRHPITDGSPTTVSRRYPRDKSSTI